MHFSLALSSLLITGGIYIFYGRKDLGYDPSKTASCKQNITFKQYLQNEKREMLFDTRFEAVYEAKFEKLRRCRGALDFS